MPRDMLTGVFSKKFLKITSIPLFFIFLNFFSYLIVALIKRLAAPVQPVTYSELATTGIKIF